MIRLAVVVMLAGCFTKPQLMPSDGPNGDGSGSDGGACVPSQPSSGGVTLVEDASHQWIAGFPNGYSMTFADNASDYPMPIRIDVGAEQLIAASGGGCGREQQVGVAVFPLYYISGAGTPTDVRPFDRVVVGPAYTEVVSNWHHSQAMACSTGSLHGNGHTTWSFFPDGRVVRNDHLQPADNITVTLPENGCSCIQNQMLVITSFFAIAENMMPTLTAYPDEEGVTSKPTMTVGSDVTDREGACFQTPAGARLAFRWDPSAGHRDTRIRYFVNEYAFVNDIVPNGSETSLDSGDTFGGRTQLFFENSGPGQCTALNTKLSNHSIQAPIDIGGDMVQIHGFGYFDDTQNDTRTRDAAVTLTAMYGRVEAGSGLKIRFPGFRSITTSVPSTWQHEDDDTFYIFFPDGRSEDDEILITPECRN